VDTGFSILASRFFLDADFRLVEDHRSEDRNTTRVKARITTNSPQARAEAYRPVVLEGIPVEIQEVEHRGSGGPAGPGAHHESHGEGLKRPDRAHDGLEEENRGEQGYRDPPNFWSEFAPSMVAAS